MERHSNTYGWVFGQVRVDPNDENTVYILGVPFSVSTDGGKTFKHVRSPGGDNHALWIDPDNSNYLIKGFDQGVAVSYDKGKNWRYFQKEINVCQFFNINYDMATPFKVYGSMQDHGSFRGKVDLSAGRDKIPAQEFENAPGGEGSNHAIDPTDPNIVYSAGFYGTIMRSEYDKPGEFPGWPWTKSLLPTPYADEPRLRGQWLAPFILSPHNPHIVYHGMQYLFRSLDRGRHLGEDQPRPDLEHGLRDGRHPLPHALRHLRVAAPLRPDLRRHGRRPGLGDEGRRQGLDARSRPGSPTRNGSRGSSPRPTTSGTVYMTQNGKRDDDFTPYVWKSTDFGKTWTSIAKGIPVGPVNVIREDPVDRNILYVGTDMGVYVTKDGGKTWMALGANLPTCYVHDLIIHPRDNVIVIATHGRGMWALDANPINEKDKRRRFYYED